MGKNDPRDLRLPPYVPPHPVLLTSSGVFVDYNYGARVEVAAGAKPCHLKIIDRGADTIVFEADALPGDYVVTDRRYYVEWRIEVERGGEKYVYEYNPAGEDILFWMPVGTLGDTLAWIPSVAEWAERHSLARCHVCMKPAFIRILSNQYPSLDFVEEKDAARLEYYATYTVGIFFGGDETAQPYDFRRIGLARSVAMMLGVDAQPDRRPRLSLSAPRAIRDKYVCIAAQASGAMKMWLNPLGWAQVVACLKHHGYRVLCVDRQPISGRGDVWQQMPYGAEDFTGDIPLQERIDLVKDADFFVGGSSGLSWLAWACRIPVVMVGGFSSPMTEFFTPYRVQNLNLCHACWDDCTCGTFDPRDFAWCPRGKKLECARGISGGQVIAAVERCIDDLEERNGD